MTAPERITLYKGGSAMWPWTGEAVNLPPQTEYIRADVSQAAIDAAVNEALERATAECSFVIDEARFFCRRSWPAGGGAMC